MSDRKQIVWICRENANPNSKPAGRTPRRGCLSPNKMSSAHNPPLQFVPCRVCKKRIRSNNALWWSYDTKREADLKMHQLLTEDREAEEDWF